MLQKRLLFVLTLVSLFTVTGGVGVVSAAKNLSSSYDSVTTLAGGTIVSLAANSSNTVEGANSNNASRVLGAVVLAESSLLAVDPDDTKAQVATSGAAYVMVSDINGRIKAGDSIAISPFTGVGMKQLAKGYSIGVAQEDFAKSVTTTNKQTVTDKNGQDKSVTVGYVRADIIPRFSGATGEQELNGLQNYVRSLTGHVVSMPRIIASLIIAAATIIGVGVLLYASIYGSIMSIGRNPLAKNSILTALLQSLIMVLVAVALAGFLLFMLLR